MNEECIIRKLVADGDGCGDDRRFVTILTLLLKLKEPEPSQRLHHCSVFLNLLPLFLENFRFYREKKSYEIIR